MIDRTLYLLHFEPPYFHARHYLGLAEDAKLEKRLARHASGKGAKIVAAALKAGCTAYVAATWQNATFDLERQWKQAAHLDRRCPICSGQLLESAICAYPPLRPLRENAPHFAGLCWPSPGQTREPAKRPRRWSP